MNVSYFAKNIFDSAHDKIIFARSLLKASKNPDTITFDTVKVYRELKTHGLSPKIDGYLQSYGYYTALQECFPQSETKQHLYTGALIFSDVLGTGVDTAVLSYGVLYSLLALRILGSKTTELLLRAGLSPTALESGAKFSAWAGAGIASYEAGRYSNKRIKAWQKANTEALRQRRGDLQNELRILHEAKMLFTESCFFSELDSNPELTVTLAKNKKAYTEEIKGTLKEFDPILAQQQKDRLTVELKSIEMGSYGCQKVWLSFHPEDQEFIKP
jgi:hypothetical protein